MGVEKQVIRSDTGPRPAPGQTVTVHCTGFGKNVDLSQEFWSKKDPGQQPFTLQIGKGWDEGVMGMQVGEVAHLAPRPMLMAPVAFLHGEYSPTQPWILGLKS